MSWDIPTQWLQPLSPRSKRSYLSWDVPGCPGISNTVATAPKSQVRVVLSVLGCPRMSWDIPTQWLHTAPESQARVVLSVLECPKMSMDIPTQWLQPLSPRSKWSYCPGMSQDVLGYPDTVATAPESQVQVLLSVLGCPRMSWDIPTQWLQPLSPRSKWSYLSWDVPGCPWISRHSSYSP